jgi:hypothetical protein
VEQIVEYADPWRRATLWVGAVAAVELVVLGVLGFALVGRPLARSLQHDARLAVTRAPAAVHRTPPSAPPPKPTLTRAQTSVLVLNGNGVAGAAAAEVQRLRVLGYAIGGAGNAARNDYAASIVMFRGGYRGEAVRLAHDVGARLVTPLDGMRTSQLHGAQVALIVGR